MGSGRGRRRSRIRKTMRTRPSRWQTLAPAFPRLLRPLRRSKTTAARVRRHPAATPTTPGRDTPARTTASPRPTTDRQYLDRLPPGFGGSLRESATARDTATNVTPSRRMVFDVPSGPFRPQSGTLGAASPLSVIKWPPVAQKFVWS